MNKRVVFTPGQVRQVGDESDRTLRIIGTDETPDSFDTILRRDGWDLTRFRSNPVFMWCHDAQSLPIGRVRKIENVVNKRGEGDNVKEVKGLAFDVQFADRETYPFADVVYRLYQKGFLRGSSVGFDTLERREVEDAEEATALGFPNGKGAVLEKNSLVELSGAPIPSNPNALAEELKGLAPMEVRSWFDSQKDQKIDDIWFASALMRIRRALSWGGNGSTSRADVPFSEKEIVDISAAIGLEEEKASVAGITEWFGTAGMDKCVSTLQGKDGIGDAESVCTKIQSMSSSHNEDEEGVVEEEAEENLGGEPDNSRNLEDQLAAVDESLEMIQGTMDRVIGVREYIQFLIDEGVEVPTPGEGGDTEPPTTDAGATPEAEVTEVSAGKGSSNKRKKGKKQPKADNLIYRTVETIDQVGRLVQSPEKRFLGCLSQLAKKSEMHALELQMMDVQTEVRELRRRGGGGKTTRTPKDPYAGLLKAGDVKSLERIREMQSGHVS